MEAIFIKVDTVLLQSLKAGDNFRLFNQCVPASTLELQDARMMEILQELCLFQYYSTGDGAVNNTHVFDREFWESLDLSTLSIVFVSNGAYIYVTTTCDDLGSTLEHHQVISEVDQYALYMHEMFVVGNVVALEASDPAQDWISQEMIKPHVKMLKEMLKFTDVQVKNGLENLRRRDEEVTFMSLLDILILTEDAVVNVYVGTRKYAFSADVKLVLHECFDRYQREPTMLEFDQEWNRIKGTGIEHLINLVDEERVRAEEADNRAEEADNRAEEADNRAEEAHREKLEAMRQTNTAMEDRNEAQQMMNAAIEEIIQAQTREGVLVEEKRRAEEEIVQRKEKEAVLEEEKRRAEEEIVQRKEKEAVLVEEKRRAEEEKRRAEEEKRRAEEEIVQRKEKEAVLEEEKRKAEEEIVQRKEKEAVLEEEKRRAEEEKRRAEEEKRRAEEEIVQRKEKEAVLEEKKRRAEEEIVQRKEKEAVLVEEKRRAEEEKRRAEEEKRRAEEEKRRAEEEKRRAEEEIVQRKEKEAVLVEEKRRAEEELLRERMREQIRAEIFEQEKRKLEEEKLIMAAQFEEEKRTLLLRIQQISGCAQA